MTPLLDSIDVVTTPVVAVVVVEVAAHIPKSVGPVLNIPRLGGLAQRHPHCGNDNDMFTQTMP